MHLTYIAWLATRWNPDISQGLKLKALVMTSWAPVSISQARVTCSLFYVGFITMFSASWEWVFPIILFDLTGTGDGMIMHNCPSRSKPDIFAWTAVFNKTLSHELYYMRGINWPAGLINEPPNVQPMCWFVLDPKWAAVNDLNSVWNSTSLCGTPKLATRSYVVTMI